MAGTITHNWNGTILTITSDSGTTAMDLKGEKGDTGARGARGLPGKAGGGARIEDGVISDETTWSSSGIVDRFAELMRTDGNPVVMDNPYPNFPLQITSDFDIKQEGSGEPYPAGVGKNLFDYKTYSSKNSEVEVIISGDNMRVYTTADGTYRGLKYGTFTAKAGTTYTGSLLINTFTSGVLTYGLRDASTNTFVVNKKVTRAGVVNFTYTATKDIEVYPSILVTNDSILSGDVTFSNVQLEVGSTATEYAPYSNIRPIRTLSAVNVVRSGETFTMSLGGDYCCGSIDWNSGEMIVDSGIKVFDGTEAWYLDGSGFNYAYAPTDIDLLNGDGIELISSHYKCAKTASEISGTKGQGKILQFNGYKWYINHDSQALGLDGWIAYLAAQYEAGTPVQVVYKLATPQTIQLTPQEIKAIKGTNTLTTDADTLSVYGRVDTMYQLSRLAERVAALEAAIK